MVAFDEEGGGSGVKSSAKYYHWGVLVIRGGSIGTTETRYASVIKVRVMRIKICKQ